MGCEQAITTITLRNPRRAGAPLVYLYCVDVADALAKIRQGPMEVVEIEREKRP